MRDSGRRYHCASTSGPRSGFHRRLTGGHSGAVDDQEQSVLGGGREVLVVGRSGPWRCLNRTAGVTRLTAVKTDSTWTTAFVSSENSPSKSVSHNPGDSLQFGHLRKDLRHGLGKSFPTSYHGSNFANWLRGNRSCT